jgi:hypothetical protein
VFHYPTAYLGLLKQGEKMARFTVKGNSSLKELGTSIFNLSADYYNFARGVGSTDRAALEARQSSIVSESFDFAAEVKNAGNAPEVRFHFDGLEPETGNYVLHIVVPDMSGKRIDRARALKSGLDPELDVTDFATESLGDIIIRGCGK